MPTPGIGSDPGQLIAGATRLAFTAVVPTGGRQLACIGTGTAPSVQVLTSLARGHTILGLTSFPTQNAFYFSADGASTGPQDVELWSATAVAGAKRVTSFAPPNPYPSNLQPLGSALLFRADDGTHGPELWRTDGANTSLLADLRTGIGPKNTAKGSSPSRMVVVGGNAIFAAEDGGPGLQRGNGIEPYRTDGITVTRITDLEREITQPELIVVSHTVSVLELGLMDATPSQVSALMISTATPSNPLAIPGLIRGLVMVDLSPSAGVIIATGPVDTQGNVLTSIGLPAGIGLVPLAFQYLATTGADLEPVAVSNNIGVPVRYKDARYPVVGRSNDDTGEYRISVSSTAASRAYLALGRLKPSGEIVFLRPEETEARTPIVPIDPGQSLELYGAMDFFTPIIEGDAFNKTDKLLLMLFQDYPSQSNLSTANCIWQSYC